jgi:hypothetical protein
MARDCAGERLRVRRSAPGGTTYVARRCPDANDAGPAGLRPPLRLRRRHCPAVRYRAATRARLLIQVRFNVLDSGWPVPSRALRIRSPEAG